VTGYGWNPWRADLVLPGSLRHLPRKYRGALPSLEDLLRAVAVGIGSLGAVDDQLTVTQDKGQQIIQLVNYSRGRHWAGALVGAWLLGLSLFRLHRQRFALVYYKQLEKQGFT
jgi:hypothetical protein